MVKSIEQITTPEQRIIISSLPYQVNKLRVAELKIKIEGICILEMNW